MLQIWNPTVGYCERMSVFFLNRSHDGPLTVSGHTQLLLSAYFSSLTSRNNPVISQSTLHDIKCRAQCLKQTNKQLHSMDYDQVSIIILATFLKWVS